MNFFHFEGSEMTLRHITVTGVTGWSRLSDILQDIWTPDVKANQLADVITGISPVRSVVNVGTGVADLILLPIEQYRKDGRITRGVQKGAASFSKSAAVEAIKLGARLATGTQVILEQAETALGARFGSPVTAEALYSVGELDIDEKDEARFSKYADQPVGLREGFESAVKSVSTNFRSAAQTIVAVPLEVYERSGTDGAVKAVIRAVPIGAVFRPMIGASEAVSKTLLGLGNQLDPGALDPDKYKVRSKPNPSL